MDMAYLIKMSSKDNRNMYYRMLQIDAEKFRIEYGRVGARPVTMVRPMRLWEATREQKMKEGYEDRSAFCETKVTCTSKYAPIPDQLVSQFFQRIMEYAHRAIQESYSVSHRDVNRKMIQHAKGLLDMLGVLAGKTDPESIRECNEVLKRLFVVIPRKATDIGSLLASNSCSIADVFQRESDLLEAMEAQVIQQEKLDCVKEEAGIPKKTILEALGLEIRSCTQDEEAQIKHFLTDESERLFRRAFRVHNLETDKSFERYVKEHHLGRHDIHYLYHGSKNMNYYGLMTQGPKLHPNAPITGKMFGQGLYYAPRAKKSIGYTDLQGAHWTKGRAHSAYLAVYKVGYKNPMHVHTWSSGMQYFDAKKIGKHDAVFAHAGQSLYNDEIIVYDERQVTLQYIIELSR